MADLNQYASDKKNLRKKRREIVGNYCQRCGNVTRTEKHPLKSCGKAVTCYECGKASHIAKFCVRRAMKLAGRVNAMEYDGPSDSEDEEAYAIREEKWDEDSEEEEDSQENIYMIRNSNDHEDEDTSEEEPENHV